MNARILMNLLEMVMMGTEVEVDNEKVIVDATYDKVKNKVILHTRDPILNICESDTVPKNSTLSDTHIFQCPICSFLQEGAFPHKCNACNYDGPDWISLL